MCASWDVLGVNVVEFEAFMKKGATGTTAGLSSNGTAEASSSSPQASFLGVCVTQQKMAATKASGPS